MPKTDMDWSKMVIYKICCKDLNITDIYIGHTCNLVKRRYEHKSKCCYKNGKHYDIKLYSCIRENGGWHNWEVIEVDKCPCLDFEEARKIERYYIESLNANLNMILPVRNKKEYYNDNIDYIKEQRKTQRDTIRDIINEKAKEYRKAHKEELLEKSRLRYEKNKDVECSKKREKITCECGCVVGRGNLVEHKKTSKHLKLMQQLIVL
jgi:hypothetical protein